MNSRGFLNARVLAVVILAVVSGASFALGFFVGKYSGGGVREAATIAEAEGPGDISSIPPDVKEPTTSIDSLLNAASPEVMPEEKAEEVKEPVAAAKAQKAPSNEKTRKLAAKSGEKISSAPAVKAEKVKGSETPVKNGTVAAQGKGVSAMSVQVGAFKKKADAESLKKKLSAKGYKAYLIPSEGVFKVRAGRFQNRKEAEVFALRLNKAEGLTAFVTAD